MPHHHVTLRIDVEDPVPGVELRVQRGRDALVEPARVDRSAIRFDLLLEVRTRPDGTLALAGAEVQGPPAGRFVYVNVGVRAGQAGSGWNRRAKVPLGGISQALLAEAVARPGAVLAARIAGRARDGGPACATVPLLGGGWRIEPPSA